jgi:hypothetical protein
MSDYPPPVDRLLHLGDPLTNDCGALIPTFGLCPEHIPDLIRMATDRDLSLAACESTEVWAPVYAWRALGELRAQEAVEPLLDILNFLAEQDDDSAMEELPEVFAQIGPAAIPELVAFMADTTANLYARASLPDALQKMVKNDPQLREECVTALSKILAEAESNDSEMNGFVVASLVDLQAKESASIIEQAFADGCIDCSIAGDWEVVQYRLGLGELPIPKPMPRSLARFFFGDIFHANPAQEPKSEVKRQARRKLAKKSRKQNRKRR